MREAEHEGPRALRPLAASPAQQQSSPSQQPSQQDGSSAMAPPFIDVYR
jgi:hypothetical protein